MVDTDTFLTTLYVMVDEFCQSHIPPEVHPGPRASLSRSEVITLGLFGQWACFPSERAFYRYAQRHLRVAFPTLPHRTQFNASTCRKRKAPEKACKPGSVVRAEAQIDGHFSSRLLKNYFLTLDSRSGDFLTH
jgi:hypothetical protein